MAELTFSYIDKKRPSGAVTKKAGLSQRIEEAPAIIEERIKERGTIQQQFGEQLGAALPGGGEKGWWPQTLDIGKLALTGLSAPISAVESGIVNPALMAQQDPMSILKQPGKAALEGLKGLALQKQGKFSDVYLGAGASPLVAEVAGLGTTLAIPVAIVNKASKTMGALTKISDRKLEGAANTAIRAGKAAEKTLKGQLDEAYGAANQLQGEVGGFKEALKMMPQTILNRFEEKFGIVDDLTDATVATMRSAKQWLGRIKPTTWGKTERGATELLDDIAINDSYGALKELIRNVTKTQMGDKAAAALDKADEAFAMTKGATNFIKKTVINKDLRRATEGARLAGKLRGISGTARTAVETVRRAGGDAAKGMKEATALLKRFDKLRRAGIVGRGLLKGGILAAGAGGVAGLIGGRKAGRYAGGGGGVQTGGGQG